MVQKGYVDENESWLIFNLSLYRGLSLSLSRARAHARTHTHRHTHAHKYTSTSTHTDTHVLKCTHAERLIHIYAHAYKLIFENINYLYELFSPSLLLSFSHNRDYSVFILAVFCHLSQMIFLVLVCAWMCVCAWVWVCARVCVCECVHKYVRECAKVCVSMCDCMIVFHIFSLIV